MDYPQKNQRWVFHGETEGQAAGEGVERRVLAYCDDMMCVENRFVKGSIGAMHSHPHTQITYVVSGVFEFTIDGEVHTVKAWCFLKVSSFISFKNALIPSAWASITDASAKPSGRSAG